MAKQLSKIQLKRSVFRLKPSHFCIQAFIIGLCVLSASISLVYTAKCSSSVPSSVTTTSDQCSFSAGSAFFTFGVVGGPLSNSLYYSYRIYINDYAVIRKVNASGSQIWMVTYGFFPSSKSLSVDAAEQCVYICRSTPTMTVIRLSASNGSISSQHQFTGINSNDYEIKTFPLADLSAYFVIGFDSSTNISKICKYIFSSSNTQCQSFSNIITGYGHLMISSTQFFVLGVTPASPYNLQMYKITFLATSVNWANKIACTSGTCVSNISEAMLSSDKSTIYTFFIFAPAATTKYLYFAGLSVSDGSVLTTRYRSSISVDGLYGSNLNGDYVIASTSSATYLVIYSISTFTFSIKSFLSYTYSIGLELSSGRFVIGACSSSFKGYTAKFVPESISLTTDFSPAAWSMTILSSGSDSITAQNGVTISTPDAPFTPFVVAYPSQQSVTYNLISSSTTDVYFQIITQTFSVTESTTVTQAPVLPCSFSGTTTIDYSLGSYNGTNSPTFVTINSVTGNIIIAAPNVSSTTIYNFSILSAIPGATGLVQTAIKLTVNKCTPSNCKQCSVPDSSVCTICNSGYNLDSGSCILPESETAKSLSISNQAFIGTISILSVIFSFTNLSSIATLWSVINQVQVFSFLFLTGVFLPKDIEDIMTGLTICINPFSYLQLKFNGNYNFVSVYFDFGLENANLKKLGIQSDSTIVNITSLILSIVIFWFLHLFVFLIQKLLPKESKSNCCNSTLIGIHWILCKLMTLFSFALYIRVILSTNQYTLISSFSEIYEFNIFKTKRIISLVLAFLVFIACIAMIIVTILFALSKHDHQFSESSEKRSKFAHLFNGVSINKKSRLFICLLQIRRVVFVVLLITIEPVSSILLISLLIALQSIYLVFLVVIRPFEEVKCNIIEIVNEVYYLTMLASLLKYNTAATWEGTPTTAYTWFIISNSFVYLFIITVDGARKIIPKIVNRYCKKNTESVENKNIQPNVTSRIDNSANEVDNSNVRVDRENSSVNIQFGSKTTRHRVGNRVYVKR